MDNRVTIYEVATKAKVSLATVSRVINNSKSVSEKTRSKVLKVINDLGYKPNLLAQSLVTNKTTSIGVIIPSANYVYLSNMLNGISDVAKENNFTINLFTSSHSRNDAILSIEKIIKGQVDGVIIFDDELNEDDISKFNKYNVPVVSVNNNIKGEKVASIPFGYEHLLKSILLDYFNKGDKKMYFLHVHNSGQLLTRIENQFIKIHKENNLPYEIINSDDSYLRTYNDFLERFKKIRKGYFIAYRDSLAASIINAAIDNNLSIPKDIEVLSLIGTKYSHIIRPTISNLYIDMYEVGKRAMNMLIDLINNNLNEKIYKFNSTYLKKDTTKY